MLKKIMKLLLPYWKTECLAIGLTFAVSSLRLVGPWAQKILIDSAFLNKNLQILYQVILIWWLAIILDILIEAVRDYMFTSVAEKTIRDLRGKVYSDLQNRNLEQLKEGSVGTTMYVFTNGIPQLGVLFQHTIPDFLFYAIWFLVSYVTILMLNWKIALISIPFIVLYALMCKFSSKPVRDASKKMMENERSITSTLQESINAIKDIKANNLEEWDKTRIGTMFSKQVKLVIMQRMTQYASFASGHFMHLSLSVLIFLIGGRYVIDGSMTIGTLIAVVGYVNILFTPVRQFIAINNQYQTSLSAIDLISDFLNIDETNEVNKLDLVEKNLTVEFNNVSFKYTGSDKQTIENINLKINQGDKIAIIGKSGSGKSTLISLLMKFYNKTGGAITVNNIGIDELKVKELRKRVGYSSRDGILFRQSIKDNILIGLESFSEEAFLRAVKISRVDEFVDNLEGKYNFMLSQNGENLSSGQRQRILIARMLMRDTSILILDETTSGLDIDLENEVLEGIFSAYGEKTIIAVTHRVNQLDKFDNIVVLENGNIVDADQYTELLSRGEITHQESCRYIDENHEQSFCLA